MRNFKTTNHSKVVLDFVDWYYTWNDIRDYFALDELKGYIVLNGKYCDLKDIRDVDLNDEGMEYLLRLHSHTDTDKDKYDKRDLEYLNSRYGHFEKDYEVRPFYISYYGTGAYRVQFSMGEEGQGLMLIKRRENREEMNNAERLTKLCFEHYVQGEFYYVQLYSPHQAFFKEEAMKQLKKHITFWDYEDGATFFLTEEEAKESIDTKTWGEIIESTESLTFDSFELTDN